MKSHKLLSLAELGELLLTILRRCSPEEFLEAPSSTAPEWDLAEELPPAPSSRRRR